MSAEFITALGAPKKLNSKLKFSFHPAEFLMTSFGRHFKKYNYNCTIYILQLQKFSINYTL